MTGTQNSYLINLQGEKNNQNLCLEGQAAQ